MAINVLNTKRRSFIETFPIRSTRFSSLCTLIFKGHLWWHSCQKLALALLYVPKVQISHTRYFPLSLLTRVLLSPSSQWLTKYQCKLLRPLHPFVPFAPFVPFKTELCSIFHSFCHMILWSTKESLCSGWYSTRGNSYTGTLLGGTVSQEQF